MLVSELILNLMDFKSKYGDLEVMCGDYEVLGVVHRIAENKPKDYNMPDGFEYAEIDRND